MWFLFCMLYNIQKDRRCLLGDSRPRIERMFGHRTGTPGLEATLHSAASKRAWEVSPITQSEVSHEKEEAISEAEQAISTPRPALDYEPANAAPFWERA